MQKPTVDRRRCQFLFLLFVITVLCRPRVRRRLQVRWTSIPKPRSPRSDLDFSFPATRGEEGMPVGNGRMGSLDWTTPRRSSSRSIVAMPSAWMVLSQFPLRRLGLRQRLRLRAYQRGQRRSRCLQRPDFQSTLGTLR
jgi:hypothetical protein